MRGRLLALAVAAVLAAFVAPSLSLAQSGWDTFWRRPAPEPTPCVLDKCLNGGAKPATPQPSNTAQAGSGEIAPGAFDFYLLTLSWSPGFCDTGGESKSPDQCSVGSGLGFVVHGLWPQYTHGYPQDCDANSRPVSQSALALTRGVFPSEGLARYEWRKHGTCTGLSPDAFFASVRRARDSIVVPDAFKTLRQEQSFAPNEIARAFIAANSGLRLSAMAVGCGRGELEDVRLCLSKDLRSFVDCPEVSRRTCRSSSVNVAPIR
jgi:ribonuclease T2